MQAWFFAPLLGDPFLDFFYTTWQVFYPAMDGESLLIENLTWGRRILQELGFVRYRIAVAKPLGMSR